MEKALIVWLGSEPGTAEWKAQTNPLSYVVPFNTKFLPNILILYTSNEGNFSVRPNCNLPKGLMPIV